MILSIIKSVTNGKFNENVFYIILITGLSSVWSLHAIADSGSIFMECYECTEAQRVLKIKEFADDYISVPELNTISSRGWINKTVHVIDSSTGVVVDYNALIRLPEYDSDSFIDITVSS